MSRDEILGFMSEMTKRFTSDNIPYLMKNRRVDECEKLVNKYMQDIRFSAVAEYAIKEGINVSLEDFKTNDLMNILLFFNCFEDSYDGIDFNELDILSLEAYSELIYNLAMSDSEVAKETAELLGGYFDEEIGQYVYEKEPYNLVGLPIEVLIDYVDPKDVM